MHQASYYILPSDFWNPIGTAQSSQLAGQGGLNGYN
jgi:hypothetical protein